MPQWHLDEKNTVYAWLNFHMKGKYENTLIATAKSPTTQPQTISFSDQSEMKLKQISLGFKRYLPGDKRLTHTIPLAPVIGAYLIIAAEHTSQAGVTKNRRFIELRKMNILSPYAKWYMQYCLCNQYCK